MAVARAEKARVALSRAAVVTAVVMVACSGGDGHGGGNVRVQGGSEWVRQYAISNTQCGSKRGG